MIGFKLETQIECATSLVMQYADTEQAFEDSIMIRKMGRHLGALTIFTYKKGTLKYLQCRKIFMKRETEIQQISNIILFGIIIEWRNIDIVNNCDNIETMDSSVIIEIVDIVAEGNWMTWNHGQ